MNSFVISLVRLILVAYNKSFPTNTGIMKEITRRNKIFLVAYLAIVLSEIFSPFSQFHGRSIPSHSLGLDHVTIFGFIVGKGYFPTPLVLGVECDLLWLMEHSSRCDSTEARNALVG